MPQWRSLWLWRCTESPEQRTSGIDGAVLVGGPARLGEAGVRPRLRRDPPDRRGDYRRRRAVIPGTGRYAGQRRAVRGELLRNRYQRSRRALDAHTARHHRWSPRARDPRRRPARGRGGRCHLSRTPTSPPAVRFTTLTQICDTLDATRAELFSIRPE